MEWGRKRKWVSVRRTGRHADRLSDQTSKTVACRSIILHPHYFFIHGGEEMYTYNSFMPFSYSSFIIDQISRFGVNAGTVLRPGCRSGTFLIIPDLNGKMRFTLIKRVMDIIQTIYRMKEFREIIRSFSV